MRQKSLRSFAVLLAFAFGVVIVGSGNFSNAQERLPTRASRGRQIYLSGTSPAGKNITAYVFPQSVEIPGRSMACVNCHGRNGQGISKGDITPADITWSVLTKPLASSYGRNRAPYTKRGVELAVTLGVDPTGKQLEALMPRFVMSRQDLQDLIAYLAVIEKDPEPKRN